MEQRKIDCSMVLKAESSIDGLKVSLYEITSEIGKIFIVEHEQTDKSKKTEFKTDATEAEKLYKKQIKKMLAEV